MNIEQFVIEYLAGALPVPVSGDVPSPLPPRFVTVEQTGGGRPEKLGGATLAVQCWDTSRAAAGQLCEAVIAAMEGITALDEISRCELDTAYNYTDIERRKPRYQAIFDIVHYL